MQMVITGRGGQGVILLARVLGEWAIGKGLKVISTETHGMATRGGSVLTQVKLGEFYSPLVAKGQGDLGIAMHQDEEAKAKEYLKEGAPCLVNSPGESESSTIRLDAQGLSMRNLNTPLYANLVMAGFVGRRFLNATLKELTHALLGVISKRIDENKAALKLGFEYEEK